MKKKILHISNHYFPVIGGLERTCQYLAEGTQKEFNVRVIGFCETRKTKIENINGIIIYKPGELIKIFSQAISLSYFKILHKIIKEWEPDIIHFHLPNPFVSVLLLPILPKETKLYLHWHLDIVKQKLLYLFFRPIEKKILKRANLIVTTSPNYKQFSIPLRNFINKVEILPSAVNASEFDLNKEEVNHIDKIREKFKNKKLVFFVGRHIKYKGISYLLEAEKYIKNDCHIIIAGAGPLTQKLKRTYISDRISYIGKIKNDELKYYFYAADVFAFPSITKNEAFGLTLLEAMLCDTATVTFTIEGSGVNWVAPNGITGIEVENRNIKAYATAIDKLISNDMLRYKYARNGHNRVVEMFTIEKEIQILISQYNLMLNS